MQIKFAALAALASISALPMTARAEDPPASPLSFNVGVASDYRYRGISQSRLKPALQGGADYAFSSGAYVGTWASTISWIKDAGKIAGVDTGSSPLEIDLYGGYKGELVKDTLSYDIGGLYYLYAGNKYDKIGGTSSANTFEIYGALTGGIFTAKYSYALTNLFGTGGGGAPKSNGSFYIDLSANADLGKGYTLTPHMGWQKIKNYDTFSYVDYSLTLAKDFGSGITGTIAVVGADVKKVNGNSVYLSPSGKNLAGGAVVLGVKYTF